MDSIRSFAPLVGRLLIGVFLLFAGYAKIGDPGSMKTLIGDAGVPVPDISYVVAVIVEIGGGLALVLGFRTRLVAAIVAIFAIVSALLVHSDFSDPVQLGNFLKNLALAGGLLQIFAFGSGRCSIDNLSVGRKPISA